VSQASFDAVKNDEKYPLAGDLLLSIAFLYPDNIPLGLFERNAHTILNLSNTVSRPALSHREAA
jgi:hypothetical protein